MVVQKFCDSLGIMLFLSRIAYLVAVNDDIHKKYKSTFI